MTRIPTLSAALTGLALLGVAAFAWTQTAPAAATASAQRPTAAVTDEPVLLELFTSQGCSSCPPADRLAGTLALGPGLVVIARLVTYWDRLGWKDTLARESNTALQQDYARRGLAGRNGVYTPQLVVDGRFGVVGSRADDIAAGVKRYGGKSDAAIRVTKRDADGYAVSLSGTGDGAAELVLIAVTRKVMVGIGSGENGGRKVAYTNVVRSERTIAGWKGGKANVAIGADKLNVKGADRYALVLRAPGGGKVLAARWIA
ncbi:MAG: DUF1223 domain-containing protein [Sphingomonadales bacterium]|nr:DUF1223 domain-containing protein [Sphingomonadales bacterium]NCQ20075.1 DUF1223 domain-containing protein [Sphingomonadales bacterium]NCT02486.1 DUF1223 domain-containing protein [Sphingomonadales bacterium]